MSRTPLDAVRDLCLALPDAEELTSHGAPNFRVRGGRIFATYAANHHGDGHIGLWLPLPAGAQELLTRSDPENYFVPPYVGPRGWVGVRLDASLPWAAIRERVHEAWRHIAPRRLASIPVALARVAPPDVLPAREELDPLCRPRAREVIDRLRAICLALPETSEVRQFGHPAWRAGKKTFATAYAYDGPLRLSFRVGVEQQGLMTADPRYTIPAYTGHNGWIALDVSAHVDWDEVAALARASYRHFALKRMLAKLDADAPQRRN